MKSDSVLEIRTLVTSSASIAISSRRVIPMLNNPRTGRFSLETLPYQRRLKTLCTMMSKNMPVPTSSWTVLPSHQ